MEFLRQYELQSSETRGPVRRYPTKILGFDESLADLHQSLGNQAIQALFRSGAAQAKHRIGSINDPAEREAEAMAAQCVGTSASVEVLEQSRERKRRVPHFSTGGRATVPYRPGIVEEILGSTGQPLDTRIRYEFESRFGYDFNDVRVHTGSEAAESARAVEAQAYTAGSDIVFASGQYSPHTTSGRTLLAHELTHVLQQRGADRSLSRSLSAAAHSVVQRSPAPKGELILPPETISDDPRERSQWRAAVDHAVRAQFHLTGPGITDAQVSYRTPQAFGALFQGQTLEDALVATFLDLDNVTAKNILLSHPEVAYLVNDRETISALGMLTLREFVRKGIRKGSFEDSGGGPLDIQTGKPVNPPSSITPTDLAATEFSGLTTASGPRTARRISLLRDDSKASVRRPVFVDVFVHEACHFYGHDAFESMVGSIKDPDESIGGARISQILAEGVPEYFAQEVSKANQEQFGALIQSYPAETEQAAILVSFLGEDVVRAAYFKGEARPLQLIVSLVESARKDGQFPTPIEAEKLLEPAYK